ECFNVRQVFMSNGAEQIPKGTYDDIIKKAEEKFSLKEGTINKQTMLMREEICQQQDKVLTHQ
ncbi:MAG: hypothetical protein ACK53Y_02715, partial [bacterium]